MSRRSNFLEANDSFKEQNLRFVRNDLEENLNQYFGGANAGNGGAPPRDYKVVQPQPGDYNCGGGGDDRNQREHRSTFTDRRNFFHILGMTKNESHLTAKTLDANFDLQFYINKRKILCRNNADQKYVDKILISEIEEETKNKMQQIEEEAKSRKREREFKPPSAPRNINWNINHNDGDNNRSYNNNGNNAYSRTFQQRFQAEEQEQSGNWRNNQDIRNVRQWDNGRRLEQNFHNDIHAYDNQRYYNDRALFNEQQNPRSQFNDPVGLYSRQRDTSAIEAYRRNDIYSNNNMESYNDGQRFNNNSRSFDNSIFYNGQQSFNSSYYSNNSQHFDGNYQNFNKNQELTNNPLSYGSGQTTGGYNSNPCISNNQQNLNFNTQFADNRENNNDRNRFGHQQIFNQGLLFSDDSNAGQRSGDKLRKQINQKCVAEAGLDQSQYKYMPTGLSSSGNKEENSTETLNNSAEPQKKKRKLNYKEWLESQKNVKPPANNKQQNNAQQSNVQPSTRPYTQSINRTWKRPLLDTPSKIAPYVPRTIASSTDLDKKWREFWVRYRWVDLFCSKWLQKNDFVVKELSDLKVNRDPETFMSSAMHIIKYGLNFKNRYRVAKHLVILNQPVFLALLNQQQFKKLNKDLSEVPRWRLMNIFESMLKQYLDDYRIVFGRSLQKKKKKIVLFRNPIYQWITKQTVSYLQKITQLEWAEFPSVYSTLEFKRPFRPRRGKTIDNNINHL